MEPDQNSNCLLCEVVLTEYEDTIIRLTNRIKHLEQIIAQLKNDSDSTRHSASV
jgi:hypothetical protein